MTRRLLITYLTITALALALLSIPLGRTVAARERERLTAAIERAANTVGFQGEDALEAHQRPALEALFAKYRPSPEARILVVDHGGTAVADSADPTGPARNYSKTREVAAALDGRRLSGTRKSAAENAREIFVAVPVASGGNVHGAVVVSYPTHALDARVRWTWIRLGLMCAGVLLIVAIVGLLLARSVARPVHELERAAEQIAHGDLSARVPEGGGPRELRNLRHTFNRTADRLESLVSSQQRFAADAAHQLRTPLAGLRLRLENLERSLSEQDRPKVEAALGEIGRLSQLVDGLLVLARGDAEVDGREHVDVSAVVLERAQAWEPAASEESVEIVVEGTTPVEVIAPPGALDHIVDNLVSNALVASPAHSRIALSVRARDGDAEIHVVDQGPGLDPTARAHAFERFWRAPDAAPGGSGLGLAIVRQLARASGGDAWLAPAPGGHGIDAVVRLRGVRDARVERRESPRATSKNDYSALT